MKIPERWNGRPCRRLSVRAIAILWVGTACALAQAGEAARRDAHPAKPSPATAQAGDRGGALYEARCGGCHDRSVHQRTARTARDYAGVRASVQRWDSALGPLWRSDEIDAVTRYLNARYYRFPCKGQSCPLEQASTRAAVR